MTGTDALASRSARTRSLLLVAALLAALGALSLFVSRADAVVVTPTNFPLPGSSFQGGDGNQANPTAAANASNPAPYPANVDWQYLAGLPGLVSANDPNALDSTYGTGSHENSPVNWDTLGDPDGVTPAKANFFNAWNYVDETSGDTFLYLSFDRQESGGNVFLAFELNQDTRQWLNASHDSIQCRTSGDLIISYEIQNGGNIDVVIQEWVSDSAVTAADVAGGFTNGLGCSKTGHFVDFQVPTTVVQGAINIGTSITNYLPRTPALATEGPELFGEAAINLTDVFENTLNDPCFSFGQISLHGRSSESASASMQDLVGPVPLLVRSCTISGTKYHDVDADGVIDAGEPTIAGWKLYLDKNNNDELDPGEPTTLTDANGNYVFTELADGSYTVREAPDADQAADLKGYVCSFPSKVSANCEQAATIGAADRNITGKDFANYKKATIKVEKQTSPDGAAGSFGFTSNVAGNANFNLSDNGVQTMTVDPGSYTATESANANFSLTSIVCSDGDSTASLGTRTATFNVASGETVTCVFTNTRKTGKLEVKKALEPTSDSGLFNLQVDGSTKAANVGHNGTTGEVTVDTGTHNVGETAGTATSLSDYVPAIECRAGNGAGAVVASSSTSGPLDVTVGENDDIVCLVTNKRKATVTIVKDAQPNAAQDFSFTTSLGSGFSLDDDADSTLSNTKTFSGIGTFGAATVTEGTQSGWTLTDINCSASGAAQRSGQQVTIQVDPGDNITCTYVNKKDVPVRLVKDAQPNDAQDFAFTASGPDVSAATLDDDADGTLSDHKDYVISGDDTGQQVQFTEGAVSGWSLDSVACTNNGSPIAGAGSKANRTATFTPQPGDDIVCTYVNKKDVRVRLVKDAQPNDAQDFAFTASGPDVSAATLDDDADGTLSDHKDYVISGDDTGQQVQFTEGAVSGWSLDSVACTNNGSPIAGAGSKANRTATFTPQPGDDIVCTYVNKKDATVTIVKDAQPNSAQDFSFSTTGLGSDFTLDDDADATLSNSETITVPAAQFGSKSVTEAAQAGWSLTALDCTGTAENTDLVNRTTSFSVGAGDAIVCTFTNAKDATVKVIKDAQPDSAQDFGFTATGSGLNSFTLDDDGAGGSATPNETTFTIPAAQFGSKSVTESAVGGWSLTALDCTGTTENTDLVNRTTSFSVGAGDAIVCTFTNRQDATVTIVKDAVPNDAQDFGFTATGAGLNSFTLDDDGAGGSATPNQTTFTIPAAQLGSKTVTETAQAGWSLTAIECTGTTEDTDLANRTTSFTVGAGDTIVCTYTNKKDATVTIVKDAVPNDPQDFGFTATGAGLNSFTLDDDGAGGSATPNQTTFTIAAAQFGSKSVTETAVGGWSLTALDCTGTNENTDLANRTTSFDVGAGDTIVCTYTNKKDATVTIVKDAQPNDAQNFAFTTTGSQMGDFSLDDDADPALSNTKTFTISGSGFGSKSVTEGDVDGWALTSLSCDDDDFAKTGKTAQLDVEPGESITCTFVNQKAATVTIVKDAQPNSAQDFGYTTTGTGMSDFSLDDDADPTLANQKTFVIVGGQFGAKTITEGAVAGWSNTGLECSEGDVQGSTATVQVDPGDEITCTYVNKQDAKVTVVKDAQPNSAQDFGYTTTGSQLSDFSLDDDADATLSNTKTFTVSGGGFGTKTITEQSVAGWSNTGLECSEGDVEGSTATLSVDPGDEITCTYVNKQDAKVTVVKDAQPNSAQDFGYSTTGSQLSDFSLDDDADATLSNIKTFTVSGGGFGTKTISEQAAPGWANTSLECSEGDVEGATATLQVDPGDEIVCTYVNKQAAKLTIVKDALPNSAKDFGFTTTGSQLSGFSLDDDADATLSDTKTFVIDGDQLGTKSVTETASAGWSLTDVSCDKGDVTGATVTVDLAPGDDVTCTYTNKQDATVTVVKNAVPDDAQDFSFSTSGLGAGFSLDDDADATLQNSKTITVSGDGFGAKSVTEAAQAGWDLTGLDCTGDADFDRSGATANLSVDPGETIVCTYTNTKRGSVTVTKTEGGKEPANVWTFQLTGGPDNVDITKNTGDANPMTFGNLKPGDYTLCERGIPEGWHSSLEEAPYNGTPEPDGAGTTKVCIAITIEPGEDATFDVDNTKPSTLVVKEGTQVAHHGDEVSYTFDVSNAGNIALINISVSDDKCPNVSATPAQKFNDDGDALLENPGVNGISSEVWRYTCSYTLGAHEAGEENPIVNTVTANGEDVHGNQVSDTDKHATKIIHPDITIDKLARRAGDTDYSGAGDDVDSAVAVHVGDTVQYQLKVTSGSSDTPIHDVVMNDPRCDAGTISTPTKTDGDTDDLLEPGEVWTYTCSHVVKASDPDPMPNTATATGKDELDKEVSDTDTTVVDVIHPAIDIEKTGPATALVGARLSYTLTVTNPGDTAFAAQEVGVSDPKCEQPPVLTSKNGDASPSTLDPGDRWTYTCTADTTGQPAGTFVNTATVTTKDFLGKTFTDSDDFPTVLEAQQVLPERPGTARLTGPSGCVRKPFNATVRGKRIARVTFFRDGKRIARVTAKPGQRKFQVRIKPSSRPGVHRITARVEFMAAANTSARTLRLSYQRCARQIVRPRFTG